MTRFILTKAFTDEDGNHHPVNSSGNIIHTHSESAVVEFDGYEKGKQRAKEFQARYGEAVNVVAWIATVPLDYLSI